MFRLIISCLMRILPNRNASNSTRFLSVFSVVINAGWCSNAAGINFFRMSFLQEVFNWCFFLWAFSGPDWLNVFPQISQAYGFSPVWIRLCVVRVPDWLKLFPQISQMYGFSPVCVLWWVFNGPDWLNRFPQMSQEYGFSPVWVLLWATSGPNWVKLL